MGVRPVAAALSVDIAGRHGVELACVCVARRGPSVLCVKCHRDLRDRQAGDIGDTSQQREQNRQNGTTGRGKLQERKLEKAREWR